MQLAGDAGNRVAGVAACTRRICDYSRSAETSIQEKLEGGGGIVLESRGQGGLL